MIAIDIRDAEILAVSDLVIDNEFFKIYTNDSFKTIICICSASYIPAEHFISSFKEIEEIAKNRDFNKFLFDKRALRAFHQPTMEWYFVEWKQNVYEYGIKHHRKILPDQKWFKHCVDAGRAAIMEDNPGLDVDKFDITYCSSIFKGLND